MAITVIAKQYVAAEKVELYFGIDEADATKPFVLGGQSMDPSLPAIAAYGSASKFGLLDIDHIGGTQWRDWRASLRAMDCSWAVSIIEAALTTGDLSGAVSDILGEHRKCQGANAAANKSLERTRER